MTKSSVRRKANNALSNANDPYTIVLTYLNTYHDLFLQMPILSFPFLTLSKPPNRSSKRQIPQPRRPAIQPRPIKILLREELPTPPRINARQVPVQNTPPAAGDGGRGVRRRVVEVGLPFFGYELGFSGQGRGGVEGDHVDALDVFRVGAEVGGVVDFVFEELGKNVSEVISLISTPRERGRETTYDAGDLVADEIVWLIMIIIREQKVVVQSPGQDREHEISPRLHGGVADNVAPHLHGIGEEGIFG